VSYIVDRDLETTTESGNQLSRGSECHSMREGAPEWFPELFESHRHSPSPPAFAVSASVVDETVCSAWNETSTRR
jgi:hypothetical protein